MLVNHPECPTSVLQKLSLVTKLKRRPPLCSTCPDDDYGSSCSGRIERLGLERAGLRIRPNDFLASFKYLWASEARFGPGRGEIRTNKDVKNKEHKNREKTFWVAVVGRLSSFESEFEFLSFSSI